MKWATGLLVMLVASTAFSQATSPTVAGGKITGGEVSEVDALKAEVSRLRSQVARLEKELREAKSGNKGATQKAATNGKLKLDATMREGMTLDEARSAFPGRWDSVSETSARTVYAVRWFYEEVSGSPVVTGQTSGGVVFTSTTVPVQVARVTVTNGTVKTFDIFRDKMREVSEKGGSTEPAEIEVIDLDKKTKTRR
jgi:hypothetical protein